MSELWDHRSFWIFVRFVSKINMHQLNNKKFPLFLNILLQTKDFQKVACSMSWFYKERNDTIVFQCFEKCLYVYISKTEQYLWVIRLQKIFLNCFPPCFYVYGRHLLSLLPMSHIPRSWAVCLISLERWARLTDLLLTKGIQLMWWNVTL